MIDAKNPLRPVSYLFELAVAPFQAVSRYDRDDFITVERHQLSQLFLFPALLLFLPICLLICVVAMAYVFFVLPAILAYQGLKKRFMRSPASER
jgi:hypothetical protein